MTILNRRDALKVATMGATTIAGTAASAVQGGVKFEGKWKYQSFRLEPGSVTADPKPPSFVLFSPPGVVTIDEGGTTGKLEFTGTPIQLDLRIQVTEGSPATLYAWAVMKLPSGEEFTNELHGWFVPAKLEESVGESNPLVVRGSIVQTSQDIARVPQPKYTTGFFVLEPMP